MAYIGAGITRFNTADELTVTGTSEFGGNVSFGDNNITNVGSLQIDSIAGDADTNTNITFAGSDVITMTTAGSERLRITSAGLVGIGTSSPVVPLQVKASSPAVSLQASASKTSGSRADFNAYNSDVSTVGYIRFGAVTDNVGTDIQFANRPAGGSLTERLRIDSAGLISAGPFGGNGNAIIAGSSSPGYTNQPGTNLLLKSGDGSGTGSSFMSFSTSPAGSSGTTVNTAIERMRITSAGLVGIGTSSPATATGGGIDIERGGGASVRLDDTTNSVTGEMQVYSAGMNLATVTNHNIIISTNNTERMSIASGGDVAFGNSVANTVSNYNNQPGGGFVASDSHFEFATTSNRAPVEIGKNNATDGQLVVLRKQNTTVGSIVYSSATNIALGNASKGIGIGTGSVFPTNGSTAISDAGLDLGYSSSRWKDLYLSGGAYLGGTASANKLDSYEIGTFVPNFTGSGGGEASYSVREGSYTKVGRLVVAHVLIALSSKNTLNGNVQINNLPFTVATLLSSTSVQASGSVGYFAGLTLAISSMVTYPMNNSTNSQFHFVSGTSGTAMVSLETGHIANNFNFRATVTYFTT
jgi:hypothetical protein